jgi:CDP-diacylglycerol---glycerol-3-phosphate 3-phosphatidyltransferase
MRAEHRVSAWRVRAGSSSLIQLGGSAGLSVLAGALILYRHRLLAGLASLPAAVLLLTGSVGARTEGSRRGSFAECMADRIFDGAILVPLAWLSRTGSDVIAFLALAALGASYLASYERAKGESLGYRGSEGLGYRAARAALLTFALLSGWIRGPLWAFVALTAAASGVRGWNVARQERR